LTYVATYKNDKEAAEDAAKAAKKGWMPQGTTATDGHVNLGRTVTGAVLTGGLYLLIGGSRSKGKVTITYIKPPDWLEQKNIRAIPERIKEMVLGEEILYADAPKATRASLVLTNQRMILYTMKFSSWSGTPKSLETVEEHRVVDLKNVSIDTGRGYSSIKFETETGESININNLTKRDADKIYALTSGIKSSINTSSPQTSMEAIIQTPTQKLQYLKEMLDGGLITQDEYNSKKADLLLKM
jgi:hypothetical protein